MVSFTHASCLLKLCIPPSYGTVRWWFFPEFGADLSLDNCNWRHSWNVSAQNTLSLSFAAILVNCAPSGEMLNYCTPHIIKENYENFLIHRCNYTILSPVCYVWQIIKIPTIISNNPVYFSWLSKRAGDLPWSLFYDLYVIIFCWANSLLSIMNVRKCTVCL